MLESGHQELSPFCFIKALYSSAALLLGGNPRRKNVLMLSSLCLPHGLLPLLFVSSNTISNIQAILVGFSIEFVQAKLLLAVEGVPSSPLHLRTWCLYWSRKQKSGLQAKQWLVIFPTRRLCHLCLSRSCVRFKRRKCFCDPMTFFGCLPNTHNIGGTSCVFWMVTFASIHCVELFAKGRLASFSAQHIGEEEEAWIFYWDKMDHCLESLIWGVSSNRSVWFWWSSVF